MALGKVLKKYNIQQVVFLSKRKTTSWAAIHRLVRKTEFKQSVVDQQLDQLQQK